MGEGSHEREHLGALIEENSRLAKEAWQKSHELEQLLAARKTLSERERAGRPDPFFKVLQPLPCTRTVRFAPKRDILLHPAPPANAVLSSFWWKITRMILH